MPASGVSISTVGISDLGSLLPLMRAYCDFYEVEPRDDRLISMSRGLIDDPGAGVQFLARDESALAVGFATVFWTFSTLSASKIGLMNDLYVVPDGRGKGVGRALIETCRAACRKRGAAKLTWETAPDNKTAQRLYDSFGVKPERWLAYEIDVW